MKKTNELLVDIVELIEKFNQEHSIIDNFPIANLYYHLLERNQCSLIAIRSLLESENYKKYHGEGLILRNMLSDFIISGYIIYVSENQENDICSLFNDDINLVEKDLKFYKDQGILGENSYNKAIQAQKEKDLVEKVKAFAANNELARFPNMKQIIEKVLKHKQELSYWQKDMIWAYGSWKYLSKYEHVGVYSYEQTRTYIEDENDRFLRKVLMISLNMLEIYFYLFKEKRFAKLVLTIKSQI